MDETTIELNERFGAGQELPNDVLLELQSILRIHGLTPQDAFFKWDSFCLKMEDPEMKPTMLNIRAFKQDLQDALERNMRSQAAQQIKVEKRAGAAAATPRSAGAYLGGDVFGILDGLVPATPASSARFRGTATSARKFQTPSISRLRIDAASSPDYKGSNGGVTPSRGLDEPPGALLATSFADRLNPGEIVEVLNDNIPAPEIPVCPFDKPRVQLFAASEKSKLAYKNYAMKLSDVSEVLDDRIEDFKDLIQEYHQLEDSVFGNAAAQGASEIIAVGRIASDSTEGKLDAASLVLETSRRQGGGFRIPLDTGGLKASAPFFPGQIVAVRGMNSSGSRFMVSEVLEMPLLLSAASSRAAMEEVRQRMLGGPDAMEDDRPLPLNIIMASGPYTADDNLEFEPLQALCDHADKINADALILCGPFIDIDHPLIASGDFDLPEGVDPDTVTSETLFRLWITPPINRLTVANPAITIVLVPSTRDAIDKHVSWPQEDFSRRGLGLGKQVKPVGNPMTLRVNEMLVGISTQDILYELRKEELAPKSGGDVLARICRHVIEQRHFFPLFPPTDRLKLPTTGAGPALGAALDMAYLKLGEILNARPDMLLLPSALPPFAKVVESVLVVNPGCLSRRKAAGTYAQLSLLPPEPLAGSPDELIGHEIYRRTRVEVRRI